ncbi:hypothetical protein MN608_02997 [Microdochium nivale]|nr:hypothetical protein MN608_02997 [Microdochium nivale]
MVVAMAFPRRLLRILGPIAAFLLVTVIVSQLITRRGPATPWSPSSQTSKYDPKRMHLLIPATSTNHHLCQLLTSAAFMGYPAPVLINYGAPEDKDDYKQHLTKVSGVLDYLHSLPESEDDEFVFMMDGFDAWFQLPGDVMIKRYYDTVAAGHRQNIEAYGQDLVNKHDMRDTVLFGSDKVCWPGGWERPACWAVPESRLPKKAFGPHTDIGPLERLRPRWLNSGTIMGPVREVRDVFEAALRKIEENHVTDSDQYYFGIVQGEQSYKRRLLKLQADQAQGKNVSEMELFLLPKHPDKDIPKQVKGTRAEYYIGLDYESNMWQTIAYYDEYLTWVRHNISQHYISTMGDWNYQQPNYILPDDLVTLSPSPLAASERAGIHKSAITHLSGELSSWSTVPLVVNTASMTIPPVVHFTGKKAYREIWWGRSWFYPHQKVLLESLRQRGPVKTGPHRDALAGAWTFFDGKLGWVDWEDGLCQPFEAKLQGEEELDPSELGFGNNWG